MKTKPFYIHMISELKKDTIITTHTGETWKVIKHVPRSWWRLSLEFLGFNMHAGMTKVINHPPNLKGWKS